MEQELKLRKAEIVNIYNSTHNMIQKDLLVQLFGSEYFRPADVRDRVKTFEDACKELGNEHPFIKAWESIYQGDDERDDISDIADILAYHKLRIICAALNEGWQPKFEELEERCYPWFYLYENDEIQALIEAGREKRNLIGTGDYITDYAGFVYAGSAIAPSCTTANVGSRLCLKSESLARYCGRQFIDIWADFYLIRKSKDI